MAKDILICNCNEVYKSTIVEAIRSKGLTTVQEIMDETDAGTGCGTCEDDLEAILIEVNG